MLEAMKVALDPTPRQERALLSHAGAARFAYNAALAHVKSQIEAGKRPDWSYYSLRRWWNAGKDGLAPWWRENSKEAYNAGLESLGRALKNYSASKAGERKGRRAGFPRFKTKDGAAPSYSYTTGSFGPIDGDPKALKLPRVGRVHCFEDVARRVGDAKVTRMTISRRAGRWYEPCQYNGQRNLRFFYAVCIAFGSGRKASLEALEELLHHLCGHVISYGLMRAEAVVVRLD